MESSEIASDNGTEDILNSSVKTNGLMESSDGIVVMTSKPLVYNYEDTGHWTEVEGEQETDPAQPTEEFESKILFQEPPVAGEEIIKGPSEEVFLTEDAFINESPKSFPSESINPMVEMTQQPNESDREPNLVPSEHSLMVTDGAEPQAVNINNEVSNVTMEEASLLLAATEVAYSEANAEAKLSAETIEIGNNAPEEELEHTNELSQDGRLQASSLENEEESVSLPSDDLTVVKTAFIQQTSKEQQVLCNTSEWEVNPDESVVPHEGDTTDVLEMKEEPSIIVNKLVEEVVDDKCQGVESSETDGQDINDQNFEDHRIYVPISKGEGQNIKSKLLEDWDTGGALPQDAENPDQSIAESDEVTSNNNDSKIDNMSVVHTFNPERVSDVLPSHGKLAGGKSTEGDASANGLAFLRANHSRLSAKIMNKIINSPPNPISAVNIPRKDLILEMELRKHTSTGFLPEPVEDKNQDPKCEEIIGILESDSVGDWRENLTTSKKIVANDLNIKKEVAMPLIKKPSKIQRPISKSSVKKVTKKKHSKDREREIALRQLADFMPRINKRKTPRKASPAVVADDLERVLSSTPLMTGKRKRRPCYQPQPLAEDIPSTNPSAIVKTYNVSKIRNTDALSDVETGLETIAIVNRHLSSEDQSIVEGTPEKKTKKTPPSQKRAGELQQLLGDEGAVRMLYDANKNEGGVPPRGFTKTKKGLLQQTKFVENTVKRLSQGSAKSLRGKRVMGSDNSPPPSSPVAPPDDELFPPAAPGFSSPQLSSKCRKKPKPAEASRILYRHSSSESFDGSEGLKRTASEISGLDATSENEASPKKTVLSSLPQRKSSRPRKVSSKLSAYETDSLASKKVKRAEGPDPKSKNFETLLPEPSIQSRRNSSIETVTPDPSVTKSSNKNKRITRKQPSSSLRVNELGALTEITICSSKSALKNALTIQVLEQLREALETAEKNSSCKAILLHSEGDVFCQGIDLSVVISGSDVLPLIDAMRNAVNQLASLEKPVIVGIQGAAVGMGVAILPLCDVVVASDAATFSTPYTRLGQGLEAAASFTFPNIGKALVSELIYKCNVLTANDALKLGLISQVSPAAKFKEELNSTVSSILSQSEQALRMAKKLLSGGRKQSIEDALTRESLALSEAWTRAECLEAVTQYLADNELIPT